MKIAVIGCGALGSYYGALLCRSGEECHFCLRTDYEHVKAHGVEILSPKGCFHIQPHCHDNPVTIGPCDLVLIGLKTTANPILETWLPPLMGPDTRVLTLQNGLGNEEALTSMVDPTRILGGLCFVCLNRVQPGVIRHMDHGLVVMGSWEPSEATGLEQIFESFQKAGIPCRLTSNLQQAHWEKLMWNIPFNGLGVAAGLGHTAFTCDRSKLSTLHATGCMDAQALINHPDWLQRVGALMEEIRRTANALGYAIEPGLSEQLIEKTRSMGPYRASTLIDFDRGDPIELHSLFELPLQRARKVEVATPLLERLVVILQELQRRQEKGSLSSSSSARIKST